MSDRRRPSFGGRTEDLRFLTLRGRFVDDLRQDGALFGCAVRSPVAYGRVRTIDTSVASAMPGITLVLTAVDLQAVNIGPLPCPTQPPMLEPIRLPPRPALAGTGSSGTSAIPSSS